MTTPTGPAAQHIPTSADYAEVFTATADKVAALETYLGPVLSVAGVAAYGWTVEFDPDFPGDAMLIAPGRLRIIVREAGDLEQLLMYAEQARQARRALRATVVDVALRAGFTDLRPFARPARGA